MRCFGGVIKICVEDGGGYTPYTTGGTQNSQQNNNTNSTQNTQQTQNQNNSNPSVIVDFGKSGVQNNPSTQQTQQQNNTQTNSQNQPAHTNAPTIININGNAIIYNFNGKTVTYSAPYGSLLTNTESGQKVSLKDLIKANLASLGAIKANNPVDYALAKVSADRNFIDAFIENIKGRLQKLHIYERANKNANLYQYSVTAKAKNLQLHEWFQVNNNDLNYGLDVKSKKYSLHEWIAVNGETKYVNYGVTIETPKHKVSEWFNGTAADYSYTLDIERKPQLHPLQGVTIGSAHKEGDRIILTPNQRSKRGAFWSNEKVDLTQNFTVKANLYLGNRRRGADGIAFVIQNSPQGRNALGMGGGGLGYRGIHRSFAVEFDTWRNPGEINGNHIGFDINGRGYREVPKSEVAIPLPEPLESGKEIPVTIKWNYLGNNRARVNVEIFGQNYSYTINNIEQVFGGTKAYIGFTGATGGERNLQYVSNVRIIEGNEENSGGLPSYIVG